MKGKFRIGGALLVGILLVLGAFMLSKTATPTAEGDIVAVTAPERNTLETKDLNNNGVADWKEDLGETVFETIQTPPPPETNDLIETYEPPETFTGRFSVAFLKDYLEGKVSGKDYSDPTAFVGNAVEAINRNATSKKYTRLDILIVDSDFESLRNYGNVLAFTTRPATLTETKDMLILRDALATKDREKLSELEPVQQSIGNTLSLLKGVKVPSNMALEHIELLNIYESMSANIDAMHSVFDDPLYALARIRTYTEDLQLLGETLQTISKTLTENGIVYTKEDPGAQFYLFDI